MSVKILDIISIDTALKMMLECKNIQEYKKTLIKLEETYTPQAMEIIKEKHKSTLKISPTDTLTTTYRIALPMSLLIDNAIIEEKDGAFFYKSGNKVNFASGTIEIEDMEAMIQGYKQLVLKKAMV